MSDLLIGAGGGGGGGKGGGGKAYTPSTAQDGLDSVQYAQLIDLISEGEIEGLKNGLKSIFINNTPLQNADNSYNFQNVSVYTTTGTQNQASIPISNNIENEISVGTQVLNGLPVIKSITSPNVDAARITITVPQLQTFTDKGDIVGASVNLQIAVQYAGGGFQTVIDDVISGRSGDLYQKDYIVNFTGSKPVDVRVTRVTADSADPKLSNAISFSALTEITYARLRYPNSALVGLRIDAEQFSSIPSRSYLVRGIKIKIPNNATVDATTGRLIYSGTWNGTLGAAAWCTCPSWILYDLLTSTRYGFGDHIQPASLDKWSFYSASVYANQLVADGFGGQEARFACNVNIQTQEEAFKVVNDLCSVFRAQSYWSTGTLTVSQDKPTDSAYLFTLANTLEGGFSYQNSSKKTRPTVALVSYLDLTTREIAIEAVEDSTAIAKYGVITTQVSAFACTSRGQASRIGKWLLYEENNSEIVSFVASIEAGVICRPGQVIEISDPMRAGSRRGGRISSATTTTITVDDATGLTLANSPTLSCILSDGSVQARAVLSITGKVIAVATAFSSAPNANSIWIFESNDLQTSTWRVLGVSEQDQCQYAVTAISYNASKYAYIEDGAPLLERDVSNLNEIPAAPTNLAFTEALYSYQSQVRAKVIAGWKPVLGVNQYEVRWRKDSGNWTVIRQPSVDFEILDITPGLFEFTVYSLNAAGKPSSTALEGSITALGKTAPPSDVTGFISTIDPNIGVVFSWDVVPDIDASGYEIRRGDSWEAATLVTQVSATTYKLGILPQGTTTYLIRALDTSGVYSSAAASTTVTISSPSTPSVTAAVAGDLVTLSWPVSTGSYSIASYTVRSNVGAVGEISTTTTSLPITWNGSRTFYVKAVDLTGAQSSEGAVTVNVIQASAPSVSLAYAGQNAVLTWNEVNGTTKTRFYQISIGASVIGTIQTTNFSIRVDWTGARTFSVRAVDANGNFGSSASIAISPSAASAPTVSSSISGAQVVLTWESVQGSLPTAYYDVRYGSNFASGISLGIINGNSFTTNGAWNGNRTFWVAATDTAGNLGAAGSRTVTINSAAAPTITPSFAGNMLTLNWTGVSGSLPVIAYEIRRGATYATATVLGQTQSTTYKIEPTWVGGQTFWVTSINSNNDLGTSGSAVATVVAPPAPSITNTFKGEQVVLSWNAVQGSLDTDFYQVRRGNVFSSASIIAEIKSTVYSLKVDWSGTQKFWVVAVDSRGNQGTEDDQDVVITPPSQPTITQQVVDNNVLLQWTDSTQTLPITVYELRKGTTWGSASVIGTKQGKFTSVFETVSGNFVYWLAGIDSSGTYGTPGSVSAFVNQPPDYVLKFNQNSTFSGTKTNVYTTSGILYANVDTTETWQSHFTARGWSTPQDQINAGYPIYGLPSQTSGQYLETIDYGTVLAGTKVSMTLTSNIIAGSITITPTISVRRLPTDAWTVYAGVNSVFATNFQYVRAQYDFSSSGGDDLLEITGLNVRLDSKLRNDAGTSTANAGDAGGTVVTFSVPFIDVDSISVTPVGTTPVIAIYDFVDVPNPTSFKVLLFNSGGTRISGAFSWSARGV